MQSRHPSIFVLAGFCAGALGVLALEAAASAGGLDPLYRKLEVLAQVMSQIDAQYIDPVAPEALIYSAAKGAARALDEHSAFYTPEEYQDLIDATEGEYAGIGITLDWTFEPPRIAEVLAGSPAARGGLGAGDELFAIDGVAVTDANLESVETKLRGPVGSKVVLTVRRKGREDPWTFTLTRSWLRIAPIEARLLAGGVVHVKVRSFSRRVAIDLAAALARERKARGVVLDLRGNPGGLFGEALAVADLFLHEGLVVKVVGREGRVLESYEAQELGHELDLPLAVLIDGESASAAEIVAAAFADRGRARLFGARSYGKGSVQSVFDLADGSGLKLTVARYFSPSGKQIDARGIEPDEAVPEVLGKDAPLEAALVWLQHRNLGVATEPRP